MTDQDREAFEQAWNSVIPAGHALPEDAKAWAEIGWQACAAHHAPKVTEEAAEMIIRDAIRDFAGGHSLTNTERHFLWETKNPISITAVIAALRAAGLHFKEEV